MSRQGGSPVMMWAAPWGRMGRQEGTNLTLEQRRKYNKGRGSCYLFAHLARAVADKFGKEGAAEGEEYKAYDGSGSIELPAAFSQKNKQGIVLKAGQRDDEGEEF